MSVNAVGHASSLWSSATTALGQSSSSLSITPKPNEAGAPGSARPSQTDTNSSHPFEQLSSSLQSVLIQMQASHGMQSAQAGSTAANGNAQPSG